MGERAPSCGTVPMFLVRFRKHRVTDPDPLWVGTAGLHPALAFDHDHQLATSVGMPVISYARFEPNNGRGRRGQRRRCRHQRVRPCFSREVGRVKGIEVT